MTARRPDAPATPDHRILVGAVRERWLARMHHHAPVTSGTTDPVEALLALDEASALAAWCGTLPPQPAVIAAVASALDRAGLTHRARRVLTLVHARFPPREGEAARGLMAALDGAPPTEATPAVLHPPVLFDATHHALAADASPPASGNALGSHGPLAQVTLHATPPARLVCEGAGWSIAGLPADVRRAGTPLETHAWLLPPRTCVLRHNGAVVVVLRPRP
jgi:hypothetical protein